jgi:hypothetical protein
LTPQPTETYTPVPSDTPVPTATFTETHAPSPTSTYTIASSSGTGNTGGQAKGCDNATFVSDVNVPDGTQFQAGTSFTKTWRIQNSGSCPWTTAYTVFFLNGSGMGGVSPQAVSSEIAPGFSHDVSVQLIAPDTPGTYTGYWQLKNPAGEAFGHNFYVQIVVPGDANTTPTTPTATATGPTPTPSNTSAAGTGDADLKVTGISFDPNPERGKQFTVRITIENQGSGDAGNFLVEWWADQSNSDAKTKNTWTTSLAANSSKTLEYTCSDCYETSGSFTTKVFVDATSKISESDEGNNIFTKGVSIP